MDEEVCSKSSQNLELQPTGAAGDPHKKGNVWATNRELIAKETHNECRNPDGWEEGPWCFLEDGTAENCFPTCPEMVWIRLYRVSQKLFIPLVKLRKY